LAFLNGLLEKVSFKKRTALNYENKEIMKNIKDIKIIIMDKDFNEKIKIPKGVTDITFGEKFNHKIKLPKGLKRVTLGKKYNKIIKFPEGLEIINFGENFNQLVEYPKGLKKISISINYNKPSPLIEGITDFYVYRKDAVILPLSKNEYLSRLRRDPRITKEGITVHPV
jgi:hypothetical protein